MSNKDFAYRFGENLDELLYERGITQRELAELIGVNEMTISRYVSGRTVPSAESIVAIRRALDCTFDDLMDVDRRVENEKEVRDSRIRRAFKIRHPVLNKQVSSWGPHSHNTIMLRVNDRYVLYNYDTNDIREI